MRNGYFLVCIFIELYNIDIENMLISFARLRKYLARIALDLYLIRSRIAQSNRIIGVSVVFAR